MKHTKLLTLLSSILASLIILSSTGCIYQREIQQGNILTTKNIHKLTIGMPKKQVLNILGDPVLSTVSNHHQLSYVYSYQGMHHLKQLKLVILDFRQNKLVKITTN